MFASKYHLPRALNDPAVAVKPLHYFSLTRKEGNVLFNDALSTFYLRLNGVGHMVKDHSDSERVYSFSLVARNFYMHHPTDMIAHITVFVTPVV